MRETSSIEQLKADYQKSMKVADEALKHRNALSEQAGAASRQYDEAATAAKAKRKALVLALDAEVGVLPHVVPNIED